MTALGWEIPLAMSKGDRNFYLLALFFLITISLLWYLKNQDRFYRNTYFFKGLDAGSLTEGSPVVINGLEKGNVISCHFIEDNEVLIQVGINKNISIYKNSEVTVESRGMVGKRVLDIQFVPRESGVYSPGDTIHSNYHPGPVHLVVFAQDFFVELLAFTQSLDRGFEGTIKDSTVLATFDQLVKNMGHLSKSFRVFGRNLQKEIPETLETVKTEIQKTQNSIAEIEAEWNPVKQNIEELGVELKRFDQSLGVLLKNIEQLENSYQTKPNSLHKMLNEEQWLNEFDKTLVDLDSVITILTEGNIRLNVDIF